MNYYRMKLENILKEEKRLAKHKQEKQGSEKYQNVLARNFYLSVPGSGGTEVKPNITKLSGSVLDELSTRLAHTEVQKSLQKRK